jgi:Xaa-Pro dipeptidase
MAIDQPPTAFSAAEFQRRAAAARRLLDEAHLDALLIFGNSSECRMNQADIYWLSNFSGVRENYLLFPRRSDPVLFVQTFNHVPYARRVSVIADVRPGGGGSASHDVGETIGKEVAQRGLASVGVVGLMPYQHHGRLRATAPGVALHDATVAFRSLRCVKSAEELAWIRRAAQLTDTAHAALERHVRPGMREFELLEIIEGAYPHHDAETQVAFVGSTSPAEPDLCVPSQFPSDRVLGAGDLILTELSVAAHGYTAQSLRTFSIAEEPGPEVQRLYAAAEDAFARLAVAVRTGAGVADVLAAADVVSERGFVMVDAALHGFSIGLLPPVVRSRQSPWPAGVGEWRFRTNETVVLQPNVVRKDHRLGVQVGDLCRVTEAGAEPLHGHSRALIVCGG